MLGSWGKKSLALQKTYRFKNKANPQDYAVKLYKSTDIIMSILENSVLQKLFKSSTFGSDIDFCG